MKHKIKCLLAIFLFATYPTISKFVLQRNSPIVLTFLTEILSVAVLIFVFGFFPELKKYLAMKKKKNLIYLVGMGIFAGVLGPLLNLTGLRHSSVINLVVLVSLQTPFTVLLSYIFLKEKITINYFAGVVLSVLGIAIYGTDFFQIPLQFTWNDLYFVAAALAFSAGDVLYKKKLSHISHEMVLISRNLFGALIIFLAIALFSGETRFDVSFDQVSTIGRVTRAIVPAQS
ncbi:MAG: DMT family transporter, partial [Patescibacteria group bacterium]